MRAHPPLRYVLSLFFLLVWGVAHAEPVAGSGDWALFKQRFLSSEGRIIDTGNGNISHSEGQGTGLLLAAHYGDRAAFDRILAWTQTHLQVRGDALFAWKWVPDAKGDAVPDKNNASDGDLLIAWALYRGAEKWREPKYREAARRISRDIVTGLVRETGHGSVLLPGRDGFAKEGLITLNLSYWIFPAFKELSRVDGAPEWKRLTESGLGLLKAARFGRWQLPPDWLSVNGKIDVAEGFRPLFGYDAVRIPLYLTWAGIGDPVLFKPYLDYWDYFDGARFLPSWTNLRDDSVDSHDASPGIKAVRMLARHAARGSALSLPPLNPQQDYYSSALLLLTRMASAAEGQP